MTTYFNPVIGKINLRQYCHLQGTGTTGANSQPLSCDGAPSCLGSDLLGWECISEDFISVRVILPDQQCPSSISCQILLNGSPVQCETPVMLDSDQDCDEGCVVLYQLCSQSCLGTESLSVVCDGYETANCELTSSDTSA